MGQSQRLVGTLTRVASSPQVPATSVDHAVVLVGMSQSNNAWVVRNQWGSSWGVSSSGQALDSSSSFQYCYLLNENYGYTCSGNVYTTGTTTWADVCPESCGVSAADLVTSGGYIQLEWGANACSMDSTVVYPTVTAV